MNESVRETAAGLADSAKEQVRSQFDQKKGTALGEIDTLVSALRRAGSELGDNGGMSGRVIDTVASRLESFSRSMDGKDLNGVLQGVETFARRNPAAFLGSAIAVGFLASRFLKSSGGGSPMQYRDDYAGAGYATSYGSDREFAPIPPPRPSTGAGMGGGYGTGAAGTSGSSGFGSGTASPAGGSDFASPTSGSVIDTPLDFGTTSSDFGGITGTTGNTGRKGGGSGNSGGVGNTGRQ